MCLLPFPWMAYLFGKQDAWAQTISTESQLQIYSLNVAWKQGSGLAPSPKTQTWVPILSDEELLAQLFRHFGGLPIGGQDARLRKRTSHPNGDH